MVKKIVTKEINAFITYLGMQGHPSFVSYIYMLNDNERNVSFSRKLQKHHRIGATYPVVINDKSFTTRKLDFAVDKPGFKVSTKMIVDCVHQDKALKNMIKARSEEKKLEKIARDFAVKMKSMYQRASNANQIAMVRAFVEKLEEI